MDFRSFLREKQGILSAVSVGSGILFPGCRLRLLRFRCLLCLFCRWQLIDIKSDSVPFLRKMLQVKRAFTPLQIGQDGGNLGHFVRSNIIAQKHTDLTEPKLDVPVAAHDPIR